MTEAFFQSSGTIPWEREALKIKVSDGTSSLAISFSKLATILSGPPALFDFKFSSNLVTPSIVNSILWISGKVIPETVGQHTGVLPCKTEAK